MKNTINFKDLTDIEAKEENLVHKVKEVTLVKVESIPKEPKETVDMTR